MVRRFLIYTFIFAVLFISCIVIALPDKADDFCRISLVSDNDIECQLFYSDDINEDFKEEKSVKINAEGKKNTVFDANGCKWLRIDFSDRAGEHIKLSSAVWYYSFVKSNGFFIETSNDTEYTEKDGYIDINTTGEDGFIVISQSDTIKKSFTEIIPIYKLVICLVISILITFMLYKYIEINEGIRLIKTFISERKLIGKLTLNDFKTKYSGSYFGIIWAIVQPLCQIAVYWFVFQIGLRSQAVDDVPFILWFMSGLVPWFFFSEAWGSATNVFSEYSYLVKKIVFKIDILPLIKVLSAVFIHLFFAVFMLVIFIVYGIIDIRMLGIAYYSLAMIAFTASLSLITSSLIVFFKDLGQIVGIILQFGVWLTPIMWNISIIPRRLDFIFKANPMYYIVTGYRSCLIYRAFDFQDVKLSVYFWLVTLLTFAVGSTLLGRLKPHFSDIL